MEACNYLKLKEGGEVPSNISCYLDKSNKDSLKKSIIKFFYRKFGQNRNRRNGKEFYLYEYIRSCFPSVLKALENLQEKFSKEGEKGSMYSLMTSMESAVMINYLVPRLLEKNIPAITKHDGVLCLRRDSSTIADIIKEGFLEQYGVSPYLKIK